MSMKTQADFWFRNVCDVSNQAEKFICQYVVDHEDLLEGMQAYSSILREMYINYSAFEVSTVERVMTKIGIWSDDLENYHRMTNAGKCLLSLVKAGELQRRGLAYYLHIDKSLFKNRFKNPPTFYFELLEQYGFYLQFYKKEKEVASYSGSDTMELYNESHESLLYAMWYLSKRVLDKDSKDVVIPSATAFLLADFDTLLLGHRTNNETMYDLPHAVINCAGNKKELLAGLVSTFCGNSKLRIDLSINTYVFPHWIIKFKHDKKTISTFHVIADNITTHLPLSYSVAKQVIDQKDELSQAARDSVNQFSCAGCGKCVNGSNMTTYKGYNLCSLSYSNFTTEYARLIRMDINTEEDRNSICMMIEMLLAEMKI